MSEEREEYEARIAKLEADVADFRRKWELAKRENTELCSALKPFAQAMQARRAMFPGDDHPEIEVGVKLKHLLLAEKVMK